MPPKLLREFDLEGRVVSVTLLNPEFPVTFYTYDVPDDLLPADDRTEQDAPASDDPLGESK